MERLNIGQKPNDPIMAKNLLESGCKHLQLFDRDILNGGFEHRKCAASGWLLRVARRFSWQKKILLIYPLKHIVQMITTSFVIRPFVPAKTYVP